MIPRYLDAQRDFSAGELNVDAKRSDDLAALKGGARQMQNWRILNSRKIQQRPGRRAIYVQTGRVDEVRMDATHTFHLCFGADGTLKVRTTIGEQLFSQSGFTWNAATVDDVRWDTYKRNIYFTFTGMRPAILTWDGGSGFTLSTYAEDVTIGGQKRTPFYRLSPEGVTMLPGATTGTGVSCTFSAGMNLVSGHVGTRMRYLGRQIEIASVISPTSATINIKEPLPPGQTLTFSVDPTSAFNLGEFVEGKTSGARGYVTARNAGAKTITVQLMSAEVTQTAGTGASPPTIAYGFANSEVVVGPNGSLAITSSGTAGASPQAVAFWDDEVMNALRGWPQSVSIDQGRLIFCDFQGLPQGVAWSAIGIMTDIAVGPNPSDGFFELVPKKCRVYHVINTWSAAGDEIVFTDGGVFLIPISPSNPLKPGSVVFLPLSIEAASSARPVVTPESLLFCNASGQRVLAIVGTGQQTRPYITKDITELHQHLLRSPKAIAVTLGERDFSERYIYVLNADGTLAVGRYEPSKDFVGWVPWTSGGTPNWISSLGSKLMFVTAYGAGSVAEYQDDTVVLDAATPIYNPAPGLVPGGGQGPFWWMPGATVELMDGLMPLGSYPVNSAGYIIHDPSIDLTLETHPNMIGGLWPPLVFEPFMPNQSEGPSAKQRLRRRRITWAAFSVQNSTGFKIEGMAPLHYFQRIPTWLQGENAAAAPPAREDTYSFRPTGRDYDPRLVLTKDVPGPLRIIEFGAEVTV